MGLINREKRQHAWPARTMAPPTFACAGVRAPRCSLVRCPSHQRPRRWPPWRNARKVLPQGRCLGSRGFGLGSPLVPSSTPHACSGPSTGFGGLTAVRPLRTHRPLGASTRPRSAGRPPPATGLAVTHARRREALRTSRAPNRQVGGHLLRCSRSPGASADSLTRHATPAASSSHYASDCCCLHCGLPFCPHTRPAYDAPWVVVLPASQRSTAPHGSLVQAAAKASGRGAAAPTPTAAPTRSAALPRPRAAPNQPPATGLPAHKREGFNTFARRAPPAARSVGARALFLDGQRTQLSG